MIKDNLLHVNLCKHLNQIVQPNNSLVAYSFRQFILTNTLSN